ncbi:MAG TPA: hypothetical protein VGF59_30010 [Bryobacteraceae bacterium]|jgi:hypothetical protein
MRADRTAGQMLIDMRKRGERAGHGGDRKSKSHAATLILSNLGVSKDDAHRWQQLAKIAEKLFEGYIKAVREARAR